MTNKENKISLNNINGKQQKVNNNILIVYNKSYTMKDIDYINHSLTNAKGSIN